MNARRGFSFRVSGRVQGVNFRRATQATASALGLVGWVANRPDGTVAGYACGPDAALDELAAWLRTGPRFARVEQLEIEAAAPEDHADFSIR